MIHGPRSQINAKWAPSQTIMQLTYKKGLKSKNSSKEIRDRFKSIVNASIFLVSSLALVSFLSEFVFLYGEAAFAGAVPILVIYIWFCTSVGKLAACFGESSSSWALSVFFFNFFVLILAYFAFGEAVRQAYAQV